MVIVCEQIMTIDYVRVDNWHCSLDNIKSMAKKDLAEIMTIKSNRLVALPAEGKKNVIYSNISLLELEQYTVIRVCLKGYESSLVFIKQDFKNGDDPR